MHAAVHTALTDAGTVPPSWLSLSSELPPFESLLQPLEGPDPCGPSLRYEPVMARLRQAREAEDPALPQGDWVRPLKEAEWEVVLALGTGILRESSKDLQVAAWWLEAAVHLHQGEGLLAGIELLCAMVECWWDGMHPRLGEDGDCDARVAPLVWLNDSLPLTLRLRLALMTLPMRRPPQLTLDDWIRLTRQDPLEPDAPQDQRLPPRAQLLQLAREPAEQARIRRLHRQISRCAASWTRLDSLVDARLGARGPSLGRVSELLMQLLRALDSLFDPNVPSSESMPGLDASRISGQARQSLDGPDAWGAGGAVDRLAEALVADLPPPVEAGLPAEPFAGAAVDAATAPAALALTSRKAAYRTLEAVADYLQRIEPHSPTPYLIRRAVQWGRMPLPQLLQELLREEGDLNRLFKVLGLPQEDALADDD